MINKPKHLPAIEKNDATLKPAVKVGNINTPANEVKTEELKIKKGKNDEEPKVSPSLSDSKINEETLLNEKDFTDTEVGQDYTDMEHGQDYTDMEHGQDYTDTEPGDQDADIPVTTTPNITDNKTNVSMIDGSSGGDNSGTWQNSSIEYGGHYRDCDYEPQVTSSGSAIFEETGIYNLHLKGQ